MGTKDSIDEFLERACRIFPHIDPEVEGAVDRICKLNKRFDTMFEHAVEEFGLNKGEFKVLHHAAAAQRRLHDVARRAR